MVVHFSYDKPRAEALKEIRSFLESEGFIILEYAPEDAFLFTDYKLYDWGTGRRLLAVTVHINDKITITGMGKLDVPVSNLGPPDELQKIWILRKVLHSMDELDAMEFMLNKLQATKTNSEFFESMKK